MPQDCTFCQLIDNPDQLLLVGETDNFYAWLEVQPRAKGHTMVVPKEHKESAMEFEPAEWDEGMRLAREVVEKAEKGLGADGASITLNINESGGQMVPHAYIQVFPRFQEDENAGTPTGAIFPHQEELQNQLQDIQGEMSGISVEFEEKEPVEPHPESQKFKKKNQKSQQTSKGVKETQKKKKESKEEEEEVRIDYDGKSLEWS